ncbi:MAG: PAS domain S-box protein [Nitrospira sp. CR1.3]|nr:PAS domain S-box protein [Nitrospira sp. CR1.3]
MKIPNRIAMRVVPWSIPVLTLGIFVLDLLTPVGVAVSVLYVIPLLLTFLSSRERDPLDFSIVATGLLWADLFMKPAGLHIPYGVLNRTLGTLVLWLIALGLVKYKTTQSHLTSAETEKHKAMEELITERTERSHAEGLLTAAQEARAYAETAVTGAVASRQQAEASYVVIQLRLESLIQSAMDAIITIDEQQRVVMFNEAAERMFKRPAREAIGQPLDRFLPARFREAHRHHVPEFGRSGVTSRKMGQLGTVMGLRADGEEFPIEAAISHVTIEGKKFYTVILRDIAERKQAERLLRQSEERYRRLLTVSPLAIVVTRGDRVVFVNDAGIRLFKSVRASEIIGKRALELFPPDHDPAIHDRLHQLVEGSATIPLAEEKVVAVDGTILDVEMTATGFTDDEGPAMLLTFRDVSERRRLQEQLRRTERIAELGTLASGMAHEIGTPMNVILGRAEYLMDRIQDEQARKGLHTIVAQVERITRVMNQLLAFARRKPPLRGPLALKDVIENGVEMFQERLTQSRVRVEMELDDNCPAVLADADQMSQVLINLIMNAIHAMPDGGILRIGLAPAKKAVTLTVADTGQGMPAEVVNRIFEPFFTTKEFGKGTGLGLTVVKGIIEEHQGSITVESEQGKGTTFTILLPKSEKPSEGSK